MSVHSSSEPRSVHADFVERTYRALAYPEWCEKLGSHRNVTLDEIATVDTAAGDEPAKVAIERDVLYVGEQTRWVSPRDTPPAAGDIPLMWLGNLSFGAAADKLAAAIDAAIIERVMGLYRVAWKQGPLPRLEAVTWGGLHTWSSVDNGIPRVLAIIRFGALVVQ